MMKNYLVVKCKATYDETLIEAGIKRARGIVVCLGDDSLNMYVTLAARELNPKLLTIVRGYKEDGEKRMLRAGANRVLVLVEEKYADLFEEENNGDKEEFLQKV